jgi:histidyl-tRNA synthetase
MRVADIGAVIAFGDRSLRSQLREADKQEVRYTVMIGPDELRDRAVTVRNMKTREQYTVPNDELVGWLRERLAG